MNLSLLTPLATFLVIMTPPILETFLATLP